MGVDFVTQNQKFLNLADTNTQVVTTRSGLHQLRKRLHTFANTYTQHDLQGSFLPPLKQVLKFVLHNRVEQESMYSEIITNSLLHLYNTHGQRTSRESFFSKIRKF